MRPGAPETSSDAPSAALAPGIRRAPGGLLRRCAYWIAYRLAVFFWLVAGGRSKGGAGVALRVGEEVLFIRQSYKPGLDFPKGGAEPGETPAQTAARELFEETGVEAAPEALRALGVVEHRIGRRVFADHLFELVRSTRPPITIDGREVVWAGFATLDAVAGARMGPLPQRYDALRRSPTS